MSFARKFSPSEILDVRMAAIATDKRKRNDAVLKQGNFSAVLKMVYGALSTMQRTLQRGA